MIKYYKAVKWDKQVIHETSWVTPKNIMLNEKNLCTKLYVLLPPIWNCRIGKNNLVTEIRLVVPLASGVDIDWEGAWENFLGWWKCSVSW